MALRAWLSFVPIALNRDGPRKYQSTGWIWTPTFTRAVHGLVTRFSEVNTTAHLYSLLITKQSEARAYTKIYSIGWGVSQHISPLTRAYKLRPMIRYRLKRFYPYRSQRPFGEFSPESQQPKVLMTFGLKCELLDSWTGVTFMHSVGCFVAWEDSRISK